MLLISLGPSRSHHSERRRGEERLVPVLRVAFSLTSFWSKCEERLLCVSLVSEEGGGVGAGGSSYTLLSTRNPTE